MENVNPNDIIEIEPREIGFIENIPNGDGLNDADLNDAGLDDAEEYPINTTLYLDEDQLIFLLKDHYEILLIGDNTAFNKFYRDSIDGNIEIRCRGYDLCIVLKTKTDPAFKFVHTSDIEEYTLMTRYSMRRNAILSNYFQHRYRHNDKRFIKDVLRLKCNLDETNVDEFIHTNKDKINEYLKLQSYPMNTLDKFNLDSYEAYYNNTQHYCRTPRLFYYSYIYTTFIHNFYDWRYDNYEDRCKDLFETKKMKMLYNNGNYTIFYKREPKYEDLADGYKGKYNEPIIILSNDTDNDNNICIVDKYELCKMKLADLMDITNFLHTIDINNRFSQSFTTVRRIVDYVIKK